MWRLGLGICIVIEAYVLPLPFCAVSGCCCASSLLQQSWSVGPCLCLAYHRVVLRGKTIVGGRAGATGSSQAYKMVCPNLAATLRTVQVLSYTNVCGTLAPIQEFMYELGLSAVH